MSKRRSHDELRDRAAFIEICESESLTGDLEQTLIDYRANLLTPQELADKVDSLFDTVRESLEDRGKRDFEEGVA